MKRGIAKDDVYYDDDGNVLAGPSDFAQRYIHDLKVFNLHLKKAKMIILENSRLFLIEQYHPRESVYLFGAGPDTERLVELLSKLDFSVTVIDPRSERFERGCRTAEEFVIEFPHIYLRHHPIAKNSYCLIMTHNFQWDQGILSHLLERPPRYLGILGSKKAVRAIIPIPGQFQNGFMHLSV